MSLAQYHALGWFLLVLALACYVPGETESLVEGTVVDDRGPVSRVHVRWQGQSTFALTDANGRFRIAPADTHYLTASKTGHRIAARAASERPLNLQLARVPDHDDGDYEWISPHPDSSQVNNCANCHGEIYREWQGSGHARAATNPKFLALLKGSQRTWDVAAERPDGASVCASCHVPTLRSPLSEDVSTAHGVARSGVHCDYCHKVVDAPTDKLGTRFGRDGLELLRTPGELLTFGPLEDAVRHGEAFAALPLYKESRYCASCHEGVVFGVHAYGTYSEWLESPARQQGRQCQDCHMTPTGKMTNIAPGKGGVRRNPSTLASHHFPGGQREMLQRSLQMKARAKSAGQLEIELIADHVGHRVPTGFSDRQVLLVVEAFDAADRPVALLEGERLPASAGKWRGKAGMLYAKQLFDSKGHSPLPFWRPVEKVADTRLLPQEPDRHRFRFSAAAQHALVQVWYRRFWQEVADARGWQDNDVLILEQNVRW
jgi:nitrate/TMAO reductase-like tetraheme cytochrome c subunit